MCIRDRSTYGTFTNTYTGNYDWPGVFNDGMIWNDYGSLYTDGSAKWVLTSSIACSNTVKIYVRLDTTDCNFKINEGLSDETTIAVSGAGYQYLETSFSGNISNFQTSGTGGIYLMRIYVDGKALIDNDATGLDNFPSIASTVRANPSAGFSIVSYTATSSTGTIGHGLNAAPAFVLCKRTDSTGDWWAGHVGAGWTKGGYLQVGDAFTAGAGWWGDTAPDSNVVTLGTYPTTGSTSATYIAYCFAPVEGYSSFGSYEGNGSADGPFVFTGFRPAFILIKKSSGTGYWMMYDSKRSAYNKVDNYLYANDTGAEGTGAFDIDIVSNGFKIRNSHGYINGSAETYICAAFASHPFKTARAR